MCYAAVPYLIQAALAVGTTVYAADQQNKLADRQEQVIQRNQILENAQVSQQYDQQNREAMNQTSQRYQQYLVDMGHLRASGAESGLLGNTNEKLADTTTNQAESDMATIESNRESAVQNTNYQGQAAYQRAQGQLANIQRPSALGTGLQIAGTVANAYAQGGGVSRTSLDQYGLNRNSQQSRMLAEQDAGL